MFYVKRKVGRKYGIVDTEDNVEEFYFEKEIKNFVLNGIQIKGADFVHGKFVVNPVIEVGNQHQAVKNKLCSGSATGYKGFDLKFDGDNVIAKKLDKSFGDYIVSHAKKGVFVLAIPDMVTELEDRFFDSLISSDKFIRVVVILPKSLKVIGVKSLDDGHITDIQFNSSLDVIYGTDLFNGNVRLFYGNHDDDFYLSVKRLRNRALSLSTRINVLHLLDSVDIDKESIVSASYFDGCCVHLGNKITRFNNICNCANIQLRAHNKFVRESETMQIMKQSNVIFIDDESSLSEIFVNSAEPEFYMTTDSEIDLNAYIFVLSRRFYEERFNKILHYDKQGCAIGVLIYETLEEYNYLLKNLCEMRRHYNKYFSKYLTLDSIGEVEILKLK